MYERLLALTTKRDLPDRTAVGMIEAAFGGRVRNASYRVSTEVSNNLASRDLKTLVDAGLLIPEGERRGRVYLASNEVKLIRESLRLPKGEDDPFEEARQRAGLQGSLFGALDFRSFGFGHDRSMRREPSAFQRRRIKAISK